MSICRSIQFLVNFCLVFTGGVAGVLGLEPVDLRCEYRKDPLGIDEVIPRLTWRVESPERGQKQTASRILVASRAEMLKQDVGDLWDSGKVDGGQTVNVPYGGKALESRQACFWKVCVWDADGRPAWSAVAGWTMGLLQPGDWKAEYISLRDERPLHKDRKSLFLPPAGQYRREFSAGKDIQCATVYASALGIYEMSVNGQRVGDARFTPGWTDYRRRAYYNTFDVTPLVKTGRNAIGVWVADGWYSGYIGFGLQVGIGTEKVGRHTYGKTPAFLAQLEIEYTDGSRETVVTDRSWKGTWDGPVREADLLMGETYDARREMRGWAEPGFDDSAWEQAIPAGENGSVPATFYEAVNRVKPDGKQEIQGRPVDLGFKRPEKLEAFPGLPVRAVEEILPVAVTSPAEGVFIYNLGQNFAGVVRLKVRGPAGTVVRIRHGEMLHPDGTLMVENLRKARATDFYILRGDPEGEVFLPRFTFHGFQYVELTGFPGKPDKDAVTGIVLHSDTPLASGFECSDPVANRLFRNIVWTQRANFLDIPTDCPQRDERFGWTGDAQVYVRSATYNADVAAFFTKWLRELMESQRDSGAFPGYAPFPFQIGWDFGTAWADAGVICPWTIWQAYDDTRIIERCWPEMVKFLDWRRQTSRDDLGVVHGNAWGDWLSFGTKTPLDYVDTVYFAHSARLMSEMAAAIGKTSEAAEYRALFGRVRAAFLKKYVKPDGSLEVDTQTAYALAIDMGLLSGAARKKAGEILAEKLRGGETADNSGMTTGFLGTRPLLPALSSTGFHDLAIRHFQSRKYPSWGYEVEQGATTIWERWNSYTKENGFGGKQNAAMNSFAHYSFGAVCDWMLGTLAGIESAEPGYKKIVLHPSPPSLDGNPAHPPLRWVKAHYDSIQGRITSNWKRTDEGFELEAGIPANTTATVSLPAKSREDVTESGKPLGEAPGVRFLRMEEGRALLAVESGTYRFFSKLPR